MTAFPIVWSSAHTVLRSFQLSMHHSACPLSRAFAKRRRIAPVSKTSLSANFCTAHPRRTANASTSASGDADEPSPGPIRPQITKPRRPPKVILYPPLAYFDNSTHSKVGRAVAGGGGTRRTSPHVSLNVQPLRIRTNASGAGSAQILTEAAVRPIPSYLPQGDVSRTTHAGRHVRITHAAQRAAAGGAESSSAPQQSVLPVLVITSKKQVHKHAVVRNACRSRLVAALRSVLRQQGAQFGEPTEEGVLLVPDALYVFHPQVSVASVPMPDLCDIVRDLLTVKDRSKPQHRSRPPGAGARGKEDGRRTPPRATRGGNSGSTDASREERWGS